MKKRKHHDRADDEIDAPVKRHLGERSSDMNVTPLIDVLLVLLVIFLAALPLAQHGNDIHLPLETRSQPQNVPSQQIVIERAGDGQVTINRQPTDVGDLEVRLRAIFENRSDKSVFVVGAGTLRYGDVMPLIDAASGAGLRIGIITPGVTADAQRGR